MDLRVRIISESVWFVKDKLKQEVTVMYFICLHDT